MKILIADRDGGNGAALAALLSTGAENFSVSVVADGENLLQAVRRTTPDVVVVAMARPDRDSLDSPPAPPLAGSADPAPVVMFMDDADPAFMQEAIAAGVTSYHGRDVAPRSTKLIMHIALAFFKRSQQVSTALAQAQAQAQARQTIDAAKRLLMTEDKMSEPAAHRFLQRRAMDQQKRLPEVAATLLAQRAAQHEAKRAAKRPAQETNHG